MSGFQKQPNKLINRAEQEEIEPQHLEETSVRGGDYVEVFTVTGSRTKAYAPGYGKGSRNADEVGFSDMDFQLVDGEGNPVEGQGKFRWVIYESEDLDNPMRRRVTHNAKQLRSSVNADLTDKRIMQGRAPRAGQDRVLALEYRATEDEDGYTVSTENSEADQGISYSLFRK